MVMIAGTVKNAVQLQVLNSKWQKKRDSGNVLSKEEREERAGWTQEQWMKHDFEEQCAQNREAGRRTEISNKILYGGTLTPEEEKYLEQSNPETLQKYREIKAEKKAYEEKLKNCRTKDDVQRLKAETAGGYLSSLKKIVNNPVIPMSEKLAKAQEMLAKTRNVVETEQKFMQTAKYANLPTEAEEAQERAEEREDENRKILEEITEAVQENERDAEALSGGSPGARQGAEALPGGSPGARQDAEVLSGGSPGARQDAEALPDDLPGARQGAEALPDDLPGASMDREADPGDRLVKSESERDRKAKKDGFDRDYAGEIERILEQVRINAQIGDFRGAGISVPSGDRSGRHMDVSI